MDVRNGCKKVSSDLHKFFRGWLTDYEKNKKNKTKNSLCSDQNKNDYNFLPFNMQC